MRKPVYLLLALPLLLKATAATAVSNGQFPSKHVDWAYPRAEFQRILNEHFQEKLDNGTDSESNGAQAAGMKSVPKAVLFSAAVPGGGQLYNGSTLKAAAFFAIEVVGLATHFHFQSRGSDLEGQFESDANRLWHEDSYWNWMSAISGIDRANLLALRDYERANFSHFLPENKNQQYYENVGKYDQFVVGWSDFRDGTLNGDVSELTLTDYSSGSYEGQDLTTISDDRNAYVQLRRDANDNFKRATTLATLVIFNHIASAFDAGLTAKRNNQVVMKANLGVHGKVHRSEIIPAFSLGLQW